MDIRQMYSLPEGVMLSLWYSDDPHLPGLYVDVYRTECPKQSVGHLEYMGFFALNEDGNNVNLSSLETLVKSAKSFCTDYQRIVD